MIEIGLGHYLSLGAIVFTIGIAGIFIETHEDPDNAPSDGPNMLDINNLENLIKKLILIDQISKS